MPKPLDPAQAAMDAALLHAGPPLRDYDAARTCPCGCHPRVSDTHNGGTTCQCQHTPEERAEARKRLFDLIAQLHDEGIAQRHEQDLQDAARELNIPDAHIAVNGAPFVITGTVDGRAFYLRERHGNYRVDIAPDTNPTADIWADRSDGEITVTQGDESDFYRDGTFSPGLALRIAATAIRSHLDRAACDHAQRGTHRYCPDCGDTRPDFDPAAPRDTP